MLPRRAHEVGYRGDHTHPELLTLDAHNRYEDRMDERLKELSDQLRRFSDRLTFLLGAIALLAFLIPIFAPLIRGWLNIPT